MCPSARCPVDDWLHRRILTTTFGGRMSSSHLTMSSSHDAKTGIIAPKEEDSCSPAKRKKSSLDQNGQLSQEGQYFSSYEDIGIHLEMIRDVARTNAYRLAILKSFQAIAGKVVLDVGAGTGILSCFCVQAGARRVYAIEASSVAEKAREVIAANKMEDRIVVIRGKVEEVDLPERVDVIVSEWMGHFLLYESMLSSVIHARDKWLNEGGVMMPSRAQIYLAPFTNEEARRERVSFWESTQQLYGVDMSCLMPHSRKSLAGHVHVELVPDADLIARSCKCLDLDISTINHSDLEDILGAFSFDCYGSVQLSGFVSWFDVRFGSVDPGKDEVVLSTAPNCQPTHWRQSVLYIEDPIDVEQGTKIEGTVCLSPNGKNPRFLDAELRFTVDGKPQKTHRCRLNDGLG